MKSQARTWKIDVFSADVKFCFICFSEWIVVAKWISNHNHFTFFLSLYVYNLKTSIFWYTVIKIVLHKATTNLKKCISHFNLKSSRLQNINIIFLCMQASKWDKVLFLSYFDISKTLYSPPCLQLLSNMRIYRDLKNQPFGFKNLIWIHIFVLTICKQMIDKVVLSHISMEVDSPVTNNEFIKE